MSDSEETASAPFIVKQDLGSKRNRLYFLLLGVALLLPWNAILASMDFFTLTYPGFQPSFALLVAVSGAMLLSQGIGFFFLRYIPLQVRMTCSLAVYVICTCLLCFIPATVVNEKLSYYLVLSISVVYGIAAGLLQPTTYETAGPSATLTIKVQIGVGLSGLLINILRIVLLLTIPPNNLTTNASVFFYTSAAYLLVCVVLSYGFVEKHSVGKIKQAHDLKAFTQEALQVYKINWKSAVGVMILCTVQFMFFPGVIFQQPLSFITNFSWFVITIVTFASLCDTIGRTLADHFELVSFKHYLLSSIARSIFFIVTYMSTYEGLAPGLLRSDWFVLTNLGLFATSFGYWTSIGMKFGSAEETKNQGLAGAIMGFHLTFGICLGSAIAIIFLS